MRLSWLCVAASGFLASTGAFSPATPRAALPTMTRRSASNLDMERAVAEFKMITEDEANIRKIAGVGLGVVTAAMFVSGNSDYPSVSTGVFAAVSTYRTGAEYQ
mmetsp:Transcript_26229/g.58742  ORF Transcript_26229/g.58742 Transcript_26229/m.58742 type:complete len:104 (-) Transcript_26229:651-962(-)